MINFGAAHTVDMMGVSRQLCKTLGTNRSVKRAIAVAVAQFGCA